MSLLSMQWQGRKKTKENSSGELERKPAHLVKPSSQATSGPNSCQQQQVDYGFHEYLVKVVIVVKHIYPSLSLSLLNSFLIL